MLGHTIDVCYKRQIQHDNWRTRTTSRNSPTYTNPNIRKPYIGKINADLSAFTKSFNERIKPAIRNEFLIEAIVNGVEVQALRDTGSSVSLIAEKVIPN
jgi:hypothetical protein